MGMEIPHYPPHLWKLTNTFTLTRKTKSTLLLKHEYHLETNSLHLVFLGRPRFLEMVGVVVVPMSVETLGGTGRVNISDAFRNMLGAEAEKRGGAVGRKGSSCNEAHYC